MVSVLMPWLAMRDHHHSELALYWLPVRWRFAIWLQGYPLVALRFARYHRGCKEMPRISPERPTPAMCMQSRLLSGSQAKGMASPLHQPCRDITRAVRPVRGCKAIPHLGCDPRGRPPHCIGFARHHLAGKTMDGRPFSRLLASRSGTPLDHWPPAGPLDVNDGPWRAANTVRTHAWILAGMSVISLPPSLPLFSFPLNYI